MKKYQELVEEYKGSIAEVKRLMAQWQEAKARFETAERHAPDPQYADYERTAASAVDLGEICQELEAASAELNFAITCEYADCSFYSTREAGVYAFYREAGLPQYPAHS